MAMAALDAAEGRSARFGGISGILTGVFLVLGVVTVGGAFAVVTGPVDQLLAKFNTYRNQLLANLVVVSLTGVFFVLFSVALRNALKSKDNTMSTAGAMLVILGNFAFAVLVNLGFSEESTLAGIYATGGQSQTAAVVAASAILSGVEGALNLASFFSGLGVLLLGLAMVNSKIFPNWVAYVGIASGIATVISVALGGEFGGIVSGLIGLVGSIVLAVAWLFATSRYLLRSGGRVREEAMKGSA